MSWTADRATIVSGLPSGYTLIPANREPDSEDRPASHNHKSYSLKLRGAFDIQMQSADIFSYSYLVELKAIYQGVDGTQLITNEELAITLMHTISNITGFHNFAEETAVEDLDTKHIIFTLAFHFGYDTNE